MWDAVYIAHDGIYTQDYNAYEYWIPSLSIYNIGNQSCKKISNFKEATREKVGKGEESNTGSYSKLWTRNACNVFILQYEGSFYRIWVYCKLVNQHRFEINILRIETGFCRGWQRTVHRLNNRQILLWAIAIVEINTLRLLLPYLAGKFGGVLNLTVWQSSFVIAKLKILQYFILVYTVFPSILPVGNINPFTGVSQ